MNISAMYFSQYLLSNDIPENLQALIYDRYLNSLSDKQINWYYKQGQHEILVFLNKNLKTTLYSINDTIINGHLETIKFLLKHGAVISDHTINCAAGSGQNETIKFLLKHGAVISDHAINCAAEKGQNKTIIFLLRCGSIISKSTIYSAAHSDHLETVKLLAEHSDVIDEKVIYRIEGNYDRSIAEFLKSHLATKQQQQPHD